MKLSRFTFGAMLAAIVILAATVFYVGGILDDAADDLRFCRAQFTRQGTLGKVVAVHPDGRVVIELPYGWLAIEADRLEDSANFREGDCAWFDGARVFPSRRE